MMAETEIWQVMTPEGIFDADLPTLKQWIAEGAVRQSDRVRKGNLKWIEAGRAPMLRRVFSGEEVPAPHEAVLSSPAPAATHAAQLPPTAPPQTFAAPPQTVAVSCVGADTRAHASTHAKEVAAPRPSHATEGFIEVVQTPCGGPQPQDASPAWHEPELSAAPSLASACHFHPLQAATLVCRVCHATFCRACPNQMGVSTVFLCPLCGGFCDPLEAIVRRQTLYDFQDSGFGLSDFGQALSYPFTHLASLFGGALLYGFLMLTGLRGQIIAWGLLYGCIALVIHRVAYGELGRDFLPDFADFSFWDDVLRPAFLGLGVTLVTLGPILLLVCALLFGWLGGAKRPAAPELLPPQQEQQQADAPPEERATAGISTAEGEMERREDQQRAVEQLQRQIEQARAKAQEQEGESTAMTIIRQLMAHPGLILLLALLSVAWAVFYHPMALLVAGWTESFKATINPLVGLDTMRHMGLNYLKAFLMYLAVQLIGFGIQVVVAIVTSPFDMPLVGNLPGKFIGGIFTFYTSLVVACVLGLALFKSADRLGIEID